MNRDYWRDIIDDNYKLPEDADLVELTEALLEFLAKTDPELRDTFGYGILARWIVAYRYHSPAELRQLYIWLLEQLTQGLGEVGTDTVFLRSYAMLALSLILYRDSRENFLDPDEVQQILEDVQTYLLAEKDERVYIEGKGWANACAHTADGLKFLAYNSMLSAADLQRILMTIARKVMQPTTTIYQHDEDDRLAKVAVAVVSREEISIYDLIHWLYEFEEWAHENAPEQVYDPHYHTVYQNIKLFLRATFVHLRMVPQMSVNAQEFESELMDAMRYYSL